MRGVLFIFGVVFCSCAKGELDDYSNLKEYIAIHTLDIDNDVIACAASDKTDIDKTYIFFYPVPGATEIKYFETTDLTGSKDDFTLYEEVELLKEPVFNGYLERFVRESSTEVRCIVTYKFDNKLRTAQSIRLKHQTKSTEWISEVGIDFTEKNKPKFSWEDGSIDENAIYFQVITNSDNDLLSGTYTYDTWFQYYNLQNIVLNVTRQTPPDLLLNNSYGFTLMAVSIDNWVNLVIQKDFLITDK